MFEFTEEEFEEVLRCTAPWNACGVDSVYSFPIKKCQPIRKAVCQLVKRMVEWRVTDERDDENNRLLEGRTVMIYRCLQNIRPLLSKYTPSLSRIHNQHIQTADKQFVREAIRTKFLSADKLLGPKIRGKRSHQLIGI